MAGEELLRTLGERTKRGWADLDRGWQATLVGLLVVAVVWVA
jgi:hypothetical protein